MRFAGFGFAFFRFVPGVLFFLVQSRNKEDTSLYTDVNIGKGTWNKVGPSSGLDQTEICLLVSLHPS